MAVRGSGCKMMDRDSRLFIALHSAMEAGFLRAATQMTSDNRGCRSVDQARGFVNRRDEVHMAGPKHRTVDYH